MMKTIGLAAFAALLLTFGAAQAQPAQPQISGAASDSLIFSDADRREIEKWVRLGKVLTGEDERETKGKGLPPGLAKKQSLPPGLAKRQTLPPGLAKRSLNPDLESRLSRLPKGYSRRTIGDDVVLIDEAAGVILDILKGIGGKR